MIIMTNKLKLDHGAWRMTKTITTFYLITLFIANTMWPFSAKADTTLNIGDEAPAFELVDQYNKIHKLSDYQGKWLVLYFYPKDDTPGCTTEACNFRDDIFKLHALDAEVMGISLDSAESHAAFSEKYGLPFPLLSDSDASIAKKYDCLTSIGPLKFAKRHTFIISPDGKLAKIYRQVKPKSHTAEVIAELELLQL